MASASRFRRCVNAVMPARSWIFWRLGHVARNQVRKGSADIDADNIHALAPSRRGRSEPDGHELVGIELLRFRHAVENTELVERMANHVECRRIPGTVVRKTCDLGV